MATPNIPRMGFLSMQVCVPKDWTDQQVLDYAELANPCGTTNGWCIRTAGSELLAGDDERCQCTKHEDNIHIMLDA